MSTFSHSTPSPPALVPENADLLQSGDRMSGPEFLHRYRQMPHRNDIELIEGVVYVGSPVSATHHGQPHANLICWLAHYRMHTPGLECGDNATTHLDLENMPQPDCYLRTPEALGGQSKLEDGYVVGPPELIAEVAASSVSRDLHDKKRAYQRNGVQEYVVWRTRDRQIDWFMLEEGRF